MAGERDGHDPESTQVLRGWKTISSYLDVSPRTAQRYERLLQLPVRRISAVGGGESVLAYRREIDAWRDRVSARQRAEVAGAVSIDSPEGAHAEESPITHPTAVADGLVRLAGAPAREDVREESHTGALSAAAELPAPLVAARDQRRLSVLWWLGAAALLAGVVVSVSFVRSVRSSSDTGGEVGRLGETSLPGRAPVPDDPRQQGTFTPVAPRGTLTSAQQRRGYLQGRIVVDVNGNGQWDAGESFLAEPGRECPNSVSAPGFRIDWSGEGRTGSVAPIECNPEPFYYVALLPGAYTIALMVPPGWRVLDEQRLDVTMQAATETHHWFSVQRTP